MQILLACAKLMDANPVIPEGLPSSTPKFEHEAENIAAAMCRYSVSELSDMLGVNREIAIETHKRYNDFFEASTRHQSIFAYDGIVFKKVDPSTMSLEELEYADSHVNICSFVYGLLHPLNIINPYRMEGKVELPLISGGTMFDFWRPRLTDILIERIKSDDGILVNLASDEMRSLFDWKRIKKEVEIITPTFKVDKNGRLRTIVVYAKMCRGAMTRFIIKNRITNPEGLNHFNFEGFEYTDSNSAEPMFVIRG